MLQFPICININKVSIKFQTAILAEKKIIFFNLQFVNKIFFLYKSLLFINLCKLLIYFNIIIKIFKNKLYTKIYKYKILSKNLYLN